MTAKVEPDSRSALRRATHVVLVEVKGVRSGAPESDGLVTRAPATLDLRVEETLKGVLDPDPGPDSVPVETTLVERVAPRVFAVGGLWSESDLTEGSRYLVLSRSSDPAPEALLAEPRAFELALANEALGDARLALDADRVDLDLEATVRTIEPDHAIGPLLADYLLHRTEQEACYGDLTAFTAVLDLLERPSLPEIARIILTEGLAEPARSAEAPDAFRIAYLRSAARLLTRPEAVTVHAGLVEGQMPGVAGISEGSVVARLDPDAVFADDPGLREELRQALRAFPDPAAAAPLLDWLGT